MRPIDADNLMKLVSHFCDNCRQKYDRDFCSTHCVVTDFRREVRDSPTIENEPTIDVSKISDGYHTFADLYEQRLVLSAALAKGNPNAWKSKLHEDGTVPFGGGWFIIGFDTPEGCYTYHYELKDWDLFECDEIECGKHWDGHTSKDVRRLLSMNTDTVVWNKLKTREPTEAEKAEYRETYDDDLHFCFDCPLPDDGEQILVATRWGTDTDICGYDEGGWYLESRGDWEGVYAWARMPKYKEEEK